VQRYIPDPLLIHGYKFDLRIYVVVTSYCPLRIYMYKDSLVRLSTCLYSTSQKTASVREMHLTNYSVNKHSPQYVANNEEGEATPNAAPDADGPGSFKWSMPQLREYLMASDVDCDLMMARIKDTIIKTLIAVEPEMVGTSGSRGSSPAFEIYGFDVLVDRSLKPWVLEVNIMPSFSSSSNYDKRVKTMLMCDTFQLVGLQAFNWRAEASAAKKRQEARRQGRSVPGSRPKSAARYQAWRQNPGELADEDWVMICAIYEEYMRRGRFEAIYPFEVAPGSYSSLFDTSRYLNEVVDTWLRLGGPALFTAEGRAQAGVAIPDWVPVADGSTVAV
jgi:tubulin polyglutamylase TTLL4